MRVCLPTILMLPREILNAILVRAMQARFRPSNNYPSDRFSRALRLRLVCRLFNAMYKQALFETRILDIYRPMPHPLHDTGFETHWPLRSNYGFQELFHSYLAYRVKNESDPTIHRYVEVRRVAEIVCREGADVQDTIDTICWLGLGVTLGRGWFRFGGIGYIRSHIRNQGLSLLSAAAFVGNVTLVESLLESGTDPTQTEGIFPSAIEAAALAGNFEIFRLIQESLPDVVEPNLNPLNGPLAFLDHYELEEIYIKGKADIQGVVGAAMSGDVELLEMALYPPSRADPNSTAYFDYISTEPTTTRQQRFARRLLMRALFFAKNWDVYSRLASILPELSDTFRGKLLRRFAEYGNLSIVKNLLDNGCHVDGEAAGSRTGYHRETPLYFASRYGNADVVSLLLERGADVERKVQYCFRPLLGAIKSGNISIVQKLFEYGAKCSSLEVEQALLSEYPEMIDLVLDRYTEECGYAGLGSDVAKEISDHGLSSMLELLHDRGYIRYVDGEIVDGVYPEDDGRGDCEL
ncbi:unnamed protein product [Clonostachys rosea]|uniref:F-box domain-containing protein n=1 Tax=Bionectria ochroleuca TaxID=29856 RepID=A0ABY6TND0_BIOOC|nr:unnamed protein product [Clonostachys rosea]